MSILKKSLILSISFMVFIATLTILDLIRLNEIPLPEDDVELRYRGAWVYLVGIFTLTSSVLIFTLSLISLNLIRWIRKIGWGS